MILFFTYFFRWSSITPALRASSPPVLPTWLHYRQLLHGQHWGLTLETLSSYTNNCAVEQQPWSSHKTFTTNTELYIRVAPYCNMFYIVVFYLYSFIYNPYEVSCIRSSQCSDFNMYDRKYFISSYKLLITYLYYIKM